MSHFTTIYMYDPPKVMTLQSSDRKLQLKSESYNIQNDSIRTHLETAKWIGKYILQSQLIRDFHYGDKWYIYLMFSLKAKEAAWPQILPQVLFD